MQMEAITLNHLRDGLHRIARQTAERAGCRHGMVRDDQAEGCVVMVRDDHVEGFSNSSISGFHSYAPLLPTSNKGGQVRPESGLKMTRSVARNVQ